MNFPKSGYLGLGSAVGAALGAGLGSATHATGAWLPIGMGIGIIIASTMWDRNVSSCAKSKVQNGIRTVKN
jgi:hypothetical protein